MNRRTIQILIIFVLLVIFISVYYLFSPESSESLFPPCPFLTITGYECPGCGSQRAIHHLLHLNIAQAFNRNPLLIITIPYILAGIYFEYFGGKQKYPHTRQVLFGKKAAIIAFTIILIFWVGRNII